MRIKLKPSIFVAYTVILFAILNGPLRLNANGMASLYRLIGPFFGLFVIVRCFHKYKKDLLFLIAMMVYNAAVSLAFYHRIEFQEVVIVVYVFILYVIIKYIKIKDRNFNNNFMKFLNTVCFVTVVLAWLQMVIPYNVPFIDNATIRRAVNVYFSNENELGSALACVTLINVFQLVYQKYKGKWKAVLVFDVVSSIIIMYKNDAKLSLLGAIVGIAIICVYRFHKPKEKKKIKTAKLRDNHFFIFLVVAAVVGTIALFVINPSISTRDYKISIREMLFDNITAIIKGKEIAGMGTYHDRSTAIIYGIKEWTKTYFFGIGLGNSWAMLQMPQYVLRFANSMHNIIAQFMVEMGYFAIFVYAYIIKSVIKMFGRVRRSPLALIKAAYVIAFIFISSQSSSGILSNYLTITATIFVFLLIEDKNVILRKANSLNT